MSINDFDITVIPSIRDLSLLPTEVVNEPGIIPERNVSENYQITFPNSEYSSRTITSTSTVTDSASDMLLSDHVHQLQFEPIPQDTTYSIVPSCRITELEEKCKEQEERIKELEKIIALSKRKRRVKIRDKFEFF